MNEDDEIQILGENRKKKNSSKHTKILYAVLILAVLTGATLFLTTDKEKCEDRLTENLKEKQNVPDIEPKRSYSTSRMDIVCDTIYDVPLKIFKLTDMAAELMIGLPDTNDTKIVMALGAADIRKDKNNILGDFFIDGEQYSFGNRYSMPILHKAQGIYVQTISSGHKQRSISQQTERKICKKSLG